MINLIKSLSWLGIEPTDSTTIRPISNYYVSLKRYSLLRAVFSKSISERNYYVLQQTPRFVIHINGEPVCHMCVYNYKPLISYAIQGYMWPWSEENNLFFILWPWSIIRSKETGQSKWTGIKWQVIKEMCLCK